MTALARTKPRTLLAASAHASLAAIAGYVPGVCVPIAIANVYGANGSTDAFLLALSVASLVANSLGVMTQQAAIPFLIQARQQGVSIGQFVGEISAALLLLALVPMVALNAGVLFYIGHHTDWKVADIRTLTVLLWALMPYVVCSILAGIYSGVLNAGHHYARAAMSPAIRSLTVLGSLLLAPVAGVLALLFGYLAGEALRVASLFRMLAATDRVRLIAWPTARLGEFSRSAVAQMAGSAVLACVPLLDRMMASQLAAGSVSLLDYADRLWQIPIGFALSGFMVTSLTYWSERLHAGGGVDALRRDTRRAALYAFVAVAPAAWGFVVWRRPAIALLFGRQRFTSSDLGIIADTLGVLMAITPLYLAGLVYTRAFLILRRSSWLFAIAGLQLVLKALFNGAFLRLFGLVGIGIASALTYSLSSLLIIAVFHLYVSAGGADRDTREKVPL